MKKFLLFGLMLGSVFFLMCQQEEDLLRETVTVVNVEVPVRVSYKRKPVKDLKKSDFRLFEDNKLQNINGFFQVRKKINLHQYKLSADKTEKKIFPPRYFVFIFNLIEFNRNLEKGLDFIFNRILKKTDQLQVLVNKESLFFENLANKKSAFKKICNLLKIEGRATKAKLLDLMTRIERNIIYIKNAMNEDGQSAADQSPKQIGRFLKEYHFIWQLFKRDYLTPDIDTFYNFSKHLANIKNEKWVLNFLQQVQFPQMKMTSPTFSKFIKYFDGMAYHKMNFNFNTETKFPADEVSKLFYKVHATFHLILIPTKIDIIHEDMEFKTVSTALENCYRVISKKTGGDIVFSADLVTAVDNISNKEDVYYMLTYSPENPKKIGRIKVEVSDDKHHYKVSYDKNVRADYFQDYLERKKAADSEISITQIGFKNKELILSIKDFLLKQDKKNSYGKVKVRVRVEDEKGEIIYDQSKNLNPVSPTASIQIDFKWLKMGRYYFLVDAFDELTGKSYPDYIRAEIAATRTRLKRIGFEDKIIEPEKEKRFDNKIGNNKLEMILSGAAEYCKKLRKKAFHFFCKEKVIITTKEIDPREISNQIYSYLKHGFGIKSFVSKYTFDYQLLHKKGTVREQRILISGMQNSSEKVSASDLISSFLSERAVFGPRTLLSEKNQNRFFFEIKKYKKQKNQKIVIISVIPKNKEDVFFSSGEVWINTADFTVRQIQVIPRYIEGYEKLAQIALYLKARLYLNCWIEYDKEYNGLYFPTEVRIIETYKGGTSIIRNLGFKGWERTRTIFSYKDYKFFQVDVDVKHQ